MKFKYQAKTKEGENQIGVVEAASKEAATSILAEHNLFILSLEEAEKSRWYEKLSDYFSNRLHKKDFVIFTRQLAILLEARVPLNISLKTLHKQTTSPMLKEAVLQISENIDAGLSFSQALERQPEIFSGFFTSMVRSAELTGNLENVMGFLADYLEREYSLEQKAQSALIYPAILIILFFVVSFILATFVVPQVGPIFSEAGVELPLFTLIIVAVSAFLNQWWPVILFALFGIALMIVDYFRTPEGKAVKDEFKISLPILNKIYLPLTITRISNSASMLLKGGVPVVQSMEIIGETADNVVYREIMHQIAEDVRQGQTISASASKYPQYFPSLVTQMIAVGEEAGQLESTFSRISAFYGREADAAIGNIVELIQPVLIIGIGIVIGILFASVLLPLYQLVGTIH
ncbi:MAG: type II secretion system F family protein [Candidatus Liptonbacteria bacterium]|nr:type II secretion system F family protein [Candidatus Liptonbacteria bacterium]